MYTWFWIEEPIVPRWEKKYMGISILLVTMPGKEPPIGFESGIPNPVKRGHKIKKSPSENNPK
jgi:hypothetical protein